MNLLACPKCHQPLKQINNNYKCQNNHSYDLAKSKYLNLLLNPDKKTNNPGDSKDSLMARNSFLNQGYYDIIAKQLIQIINDLNLSVANILDMGCGEGYYLHQLKQSLNNNYNQYYGIDIAKPAIEMATKYDKTINWLVGNAKNIPLQNNSFNVIYALFTIVKTEELIRVLKDDGVIINVVANPKHLIELKALIYEEVYPRPNKQPVELSLPIKEKIELVKTVQINNQTDLINLLKMTPHYYHLKPERKAIIEQTISLAVTIDITFNVYYKNK